MKNAMKLRKSLKNFFDCSIMIVTTQLHSKSRMLRGENNASC